MELEFYRDTRYISPVMKNKHQASLKPPYILGMIPARWASTRFPGKPLALILGKTLLQRTYESAKKIVELTDLVVATDDARIFEHVLSFGGKAVMTSMDCATGSDRLAEALKKWPDFNAIDYVLNIQGDEPCVSSNIARPLIDLLEADKSAVMATAAVALQQRSLVDDPSIVKCVFTNDATALYFSRSPIPYLHKLQTPYFRHIGVYCYRRDFLIQYPKLPATPLQLAEDLEQLKVLEHGYRLKVALLDEEEMTPSVDRPEDIKKVESYLCR